MIEIEMPDGTVIEFPEGTSQEVMTKAAQDYMRSRGGDGTVASSPRSPIPGMDQFNAGIGSMVDLINPFDTPAVSQAVGMGDTLSTGPAADLMNRAGVVTATDAPEGIYENAMRGGGAAGAALIPGAKAAQIASRAPGVVGQLGGQAFRGMTTPSGMAAEVGAGMGAGGTGEFAAQQFGEGARPYGEVIGGMGLPLAGLGVGAATRGAQKIPAVGATVNTLQRTLFPMAGSGARVAASRRVRGVSEDAGEAAENIARENVGNLTPAQQSGDPGLATLENRLAATDPEFARELREGTERSAAILRENLTELGRGGDINDTVDFIASRRKGFEKRLDKMVSDAEARAAERVAKLSPERQQSANSVIVREEIDKAYGKAKDTERALWGRVPQDAEVPTGSARTRYQALVQNTPSALADDIPDEARRMFAEGSNSGVGETTTVREMLGLVSRMRTIARQSRSGDTPNPNRARIADEIAEGILDDLERTDRIVGITQGPEAVQVAKAAAEARAFSRELASKFKQGAVNTIRSRSGTGRGRVAPEAALGATVGAGGPNAGVAARDMRTATEGATDPFTEDYIRGQMKDRTVRGGQFSDSSAETFQKQNRDVLDEFPAARRDLEGARAAAADVKARQARVKSLTATLNDRRQSVDAALLQASPGREVAEAVFSARNPATAARRVRNAAQKDETGRALDGVKSGFLSHLMRNAPTSRLDAEGVPIISGARLQAQLNDDKTKAALAAVFDKPEMSRLQLLANQLTRIENAGRAGQAGAIIDDLPNRFISTLAQVKAASLGAATARATGTGNIQTPGIFVNRAKELLGRLTNDRAEQLIKDAIQDPDLMRALLLNLDDPRAAERAAKRLNAWLLGTAAATQEEQ